MALTDVSTGTLAAYFENSTDARKAVDDLQKAGFSSAHLGIAHHGSYTGEASTVGNTTVFETEDKQPSTWDKIKAWFSGTEAEPYADERTQGDLANREVTANPADRYADGNRTSDLRGSFTAMNIPDDRARYFAHRFGRGNDAAVVTVQAGDRITEAQSILAEHNADFGENAAAYEYPADADSYARDDSRGEGLSNFPDVQLLGVLSVQTVRIVPDDQPLERPDDQLRSRKEPVRDLSGNIKNDEPSEEDRKNRERSA